ncbi:MAG: hypothetical protein RIR18_1816 [Pseudomonadota bacterium]|jgi:transcriptional regulator with XRE-family HTH domain
MAKHPQTVFGQRLRAARERAGLPQDRLGVMIGLDEFCSSARISRYETGTHEPPFAVAESLAAALSVPAAYFYCADEQMANIVLALHAAPEAARSSVLAMLTA